MFLLFSAADDCFDDCFRCRYGDVFGTAKAEEDAAAPAAPIDKTRWGEEMLDEEEEEELSDDENDEVMDEEETDMSGIETPVDTTGISSVTSGLETPDTIELRKTNKGIETPETPSQVVKRTNVTPHKLAVYFGTSSECHFIRVI